MKSMSVYVYEIVGGDDDVRTVEGEDGNGAAGYWIVTAWLLMEFGDCPNCSPAAKMVAIGRCRREEKRREEVCAKMAASEKDSLQSSKKYQERASQAPHHGLTTEASNLNAQRTISMDLESDHGPKSSLLSVTLGPRRCKVW